MSKKSVFGICSICGKYTKLSFEHVPPKSTFNDTCVKAIPLKEVLNAENPDRKPWEISDLKGKTLQKGSGGYYLCQDCNSYFGSWYVDHYKKFVHSICSVANEMKKQNAKSVEHLQLEGIKPLAVYKQIIAMFCDINEGTFGDNKIRDYLLNKEDNCLNTDKYKVYMYIPDGNVSKQIGLNAIIPICNPNEMFLVSEIVSFPVGFLLCIDKPKHITVGEGYLEDLSPFANTPYDDYSNIDISLNVLDVNTMNVMDYRSEREVLQDKAINEDIIKQK